uniref:Uncharacterized protein n=1 Tax=Rhizophora mucronata TaxID=61149 RepID=A0A2P2R1Q2_RHIMU
MFHEGQRFEDRDAPSISAYF